jgi:hypothetical protein
MKIQALILPDTGGRSFSEHMKLPSRLKGDLQSTLVDLSRL